MTGAADDEGAMRRQLVEAYERTGNRAFALAALQLRRAGASLDAADWFGVLQGEHDRDAGRPAEDDGAVLLSMATMQLLWPIMYPGQAAPTAAVLARKVLHDRKSVTRLKADLAAHQAALRREVLPPQPASMSSDEVTVARLQRKWRDFRQIPTDQLIEAALAKWHAQLLRQAGYVDEANAIDPPER